MVRVKIESAPEDTLGAKPSLAKTEVDLVYTSARALEKQIEALCQELKVDYSADMALQSKERKWYTDPEGRFMKDIKEGEVLLLRLSPGGRAVLAIDGLSDDNIQLKELLFKLRYQLQDAAFSEEFIAQGGLDHLLNVILTQNGNTQSYGLTALRCLMGYFSGLQEMMAHPDFVERLMALVDPSTLASVCRQAMELLFVICNFDGFTLVHKAAKNTARAKGKEPYDAVVQLLGSGDIETQVNALTLINSLLDNCPPEKQAKLLSMWRRLEIDAALKKQSRIQHASFKTQLAMYEMNAGLIYVPTDKAGRAKRTYKDLEQELLKYEEQQPLIRVLMQEVMYYQNAIKVAIENGSYINYRGPLVRQDAERDDGTYSPTAPIDLAFIARRTGVQSAFQRSMNVGSVPIDDLSAAARSSGAGCASSLSRADPQYGTLASGGKTASEAMMSYYGVSSAAPDASAAPGGGYAQGYGAAAAGSPYAAPQGGVRGAPTLGPPPPPPGAMSMGLVSVGGGPPLLGAPPPPPGAEGSAPAAPGAPALGAPPPPPAPGTESAPAAAEGAEGGGAPPPPPPPGGPGAPPPPPPPGMPKVKFNKPAIKPKAKMKPLHWNRIVLPPQEAGDRRPTVWDGLAEPRVAEEDIVGLFALVSKKPLAAAAGGGASGDGAAGGEGDEKAAGGAKAQAVRVLPNKKYNAIAIQRTRLPGDRELRNGVMSFDRTVVERSMVHELLNNLVSVEEEAALRDAVASGCALDKTEGFALMLLDIPYVRVRLRCWDFMNDFDERLTDVGPPILVVQKACKELTDSRSVRELLAAILTVGNYVNGGNATRGQADGFNIEVIDKIVELKDTTAKGTLFEFAMRYVTTRTLPDDLPHVAEAATVEFKTIQGNFNRLAKELEEIKINCQEVLSAAEVGADDPFRKILPGFVAEAERKLVNMRNEVVHTEAVFLETVDFFTGSRDRTLQHTTDSFFGIWSRVVTNFKKAMPKPAGARVAGPRGSVPYGARLGDGEDPMADIIANIKAGRAKKMSIAIQNGQQPQSQQQQANTGPGSLAAKLAARQQAIQSQGQ
eukprot:m51a1_g601 hypothetical protein (1062) ;mRNA; r:75000-78578